MSSQRSLKRRAAAEPLGTKHKGPGLRDGTAKSNRKGTWWEGPPYRETRDDKGRVFHLGTKYGNRVK